MQISSLTKDNIQAALPELARLRIEVFRDYPYLYDGNLTYEEDYLNALFTSRDAIIVTARDGERIVGCSTGAALAGRGESFGKGFGEHGYDPERIFYCGESVLLKSYRGRGLGNIFFDRRETQAIACGYTLSAFCGVARPANHPLKPKDYLPLDGFWKKRGYEKADGITAVLAWKDIDRAFEEEHLMQFWIRNLK